MTDEIRTIPPKLTKTEWNALLDHALIVPASYIIYKVDTEYKAKNGLTGKIDYSGTDASTVIQAAINGGKGKIFVKKGNYLLSAMLTIPSNSILEGEVGTVFTLVDDAGFANPIRVINAENVVLNRFKLDGNKVNQTVYDKDGILISNSSDVLVNEVWSTKNFGEGIEIINSSRITVTNNFLLNNGGTSPNFGDGIGIDSSSYSIISGNMIINNTCEAVDIANESHYNTVSNNIMIGNRVGVGIRVAGSSFNVVQGNIIKDSTENGVSIYDTATNNILLGNQIVGNGIFGVKVDSNNNQIENNIVSNNTETGIQISGTSTYNIIEGNTIFQNGRHGVALETNTVLNLLSNNVIYSNSQEINITYNNIRLVGSYNNIIHNIVRKGTLTNKPAYGILVAGSFQTVEHNDFRDGGETRNLTRSGTNLTMHFNHGYATENSGTATISASTTVVFAHGLAGTPTHVVVGFKTTGYESWIWSADATNITITVAVSGTYDLTWDAEYKP